MSKILLKNSSKDSTIRKIAKNNGYCYNALKAIEELNELSTSLVHSLTKSTKSDTKDDIVEEFGDVLYRLSILSNYFNIKKINDRISHKEKKSLKYLKDKRYDKV